MGVFLREKDEKRTCSTLTLNSHRACVVHVEVSYTSDYLALNSSGIESDNCADFPFASPGPERVPSTVLEGGRVQ